MGHVCCKTGISQPLSVSSHVELAILSMQKVKDNVDTKTTIFDSHLLSLVRKKKKKRKKETEKYCRPFSNGKFGTSLKSRVACYKESTSNARNIQSF